jgi:hypothetical protein
MFANIEPIPARLSHGWLAGHRWRHTAAAAVAGAAALLMLGTQAALAFTPLFPRAIQVNPPVDVSSTTPYASLYATACTSSGNCAAGGNYIDSSGRTEAYVTRESKGTWGAGVRIVLPKGAVADPGALVSGVACVSAGNCLAVGSFEHDASQDSRAFIAAQVNGVWKPASVPHLPLNANGVSAQLKAITCLHTGFCEAAGSYTDKTGRTLAMVIVKPAGQKWHQATQVLSPKGATANPNANVTALSCPAAGNCIAVGTYRMAGTGTPTQALGAVESSGTWHRAVRVAPPANWGAGQPAFLNGIACRSGTCTAAGQYYFAPAASRAMWVTESKGHFGIGKEVITAPADASPVADTDFYAISCPKTGPCVAVGNYINTSGAFATMYMTLTSGKWTASTLLLPLNAETSGQFAFAEAVSCTGTEHCTAVGDYRATDGIYRSMAASSG